MFKTPAAVRGVKHRSLEANADINKWTWRETDKSRWTLAPENWQHFAKKWRTASISNLSDIDLDLIVEDTTLDLSALGILVRECYQTSVDDILRLAFENAAYPSFGGVLVTGQPGTGKTCFLIYLLVRLLQQNQPIIFSPNNDQTYFFFDNEVFYKDHPTSTFPQGIDRDVFLWSLVDVPMNRPDSIETIEEANPRFYYHFMIQVSSPHLLQSEDFLKRKAPTIMGFPPWTEEELVTASKLQVWYHALLEAPLERVLRVNRPSSDIPSPGTHSHWHSDIKRSTLRSQHQRILLDTFPAELTPTRPVPSVEEALRAILKAAVLRCGYIPRAVYQQIHDADGDNTRATLQQYHELKVALVEGGTGSKLYPTPEICLFHELICVFPVLRATWSGRGSVNDKYYGSEWHLAFKSEWIERELLLGFLKLDSEDDLSEAVTQHQTDRRIDLEQDLVKLRTKSETRELVGSLEGIAIHRRFVRGLGAKDGQTASEFWPLLEMSSTPGSNPSLFTLEKNAKPTLGLLRQTPRHVRAFDCGVLSMDEYDNTKNTSSQDSAIAQDLPGSEQVLTQASLSAFEFESESYYIPTRHTQPVCEAFCVDIDRDMMTARVWIFNTTSCMSRAMRAGGAGTGTSSTEGPHDGLVSGDVGHQTISRIVQLLKRQLKAEPRSRSQSESFVDSDVHRPVKSKRARLESDQDGTLAVGNEPEPQVEVCYVLLSTAGVSMSRELTGADVEKDAKLSDLGWQFKDAFWRHGGRIFWLDVCAL